MSYLTKRPDLMMEVIAVLVRRAGGSVALRPEESPGPYTLLSKIANDGVLHLTLDETVTREDVLRTLSSDGEMQ